MYSVYIVCLYALSPCLEARLSERSGYAEHGSPGPCLSSVKAGVSCS